MTDAESQTMTLPDGRTLGYAEHGDPDGTPIFYFHAFPGSRIEARLFDEAAAKHKARLIAVDRPGMGLSDFMRNRRVVDWPKDVAALADHLGVDKFVDAGVSGGGPYSAVCARVLPERVEKAVLLAGIGPMHAPGATKGMSTQNKMLFLVSKYAPAVAGIFIVVMAMQSSNRERVMKQISESASPEDKLVLEQRPELADLLYDSTLEALRQGTRGARHELYLYSRRWGFRLDRIEVPVLLWHGEKDKNVPPSMGRYQAEKIPNCTATFLPNEGHMGCIANHLDDVFSAVLGR